MDAKNDQIIPVDFKAIEHASYLSWPALEHMDREGWILRFSAGYTKRANSVNILYAKTENISQRIIQCEEVYNSRNLPCIFRLLSFNDNSPIETILDQRGYGFGDHSTVMVQDIRDKVFTSPSLCFLTCEEWLPIYCHLSGNELSDQAVHREMLNSIKCKALFASIQNNSVDISCALGVICNGHFGLFDMVTRLDFRNQGYGAELITGMLSWAKQNGAKIAYVQVVSENLPAVRLYRKLEYTWGYEYHYRIEAYPAVS